MQGKPSIWHNSKCLFKGSYVVICSDSLMKGWRAEVVGRRGRLSPNSTQHKRGSKHFKTVAND